jgi:hypothetical protein
MSTTMPSSNGREIAVGRPAGEVLIGHQRYRGDPQRDGCQPERPPGSLSWDPAAIWLSVLTVGEVRRAIDNLRRRGAAARSIERWLKRIVTEHHSRTLDIDLQVARSGDASMCPIHSPSSMGFWCDGHGTAIAHGNPQRQRCCDAREWTYLNLFEASARSDLN